MMGELINGWGVLSSTEACLRIGYTGVCFSIVISGRDFQRAWAIFYATLSVNNNDGHKPAN
jgi:hypothetical protein